MNSTEDELNSAKDGLSANFIRMVSTRMPKKILTEIYHTYSLSLVCRLLQADAKLILLVVAAATLAVSFTLPADSASSLTFFSSMTTFLTCTSRSPIYGGGPGTI